MRAFTFAIIGTIGAAAPAPAQTYARDYPACLHVYGPVSYIECYYTSLDQCRLSAAGRSAECVQNPYSALPAPTRAHRPNRRMH